MPKKVNRREFLRRAGLSGAAVATFGVQACQTLPRPRRMSPNDKLNIGIIGVANRGAANLGGVSGENIVALCDIDSNYLAEAARNFPSAKTYKDFRKMLEQNDIDAVVVSTPDHCHAPATLAAIHLGKHVYCEKPLTHSVYEARQVAEAAARYGVTTQMGTQIHAGENYRRVVEVIQSGAIGPVREVHVWVGKSWGGGDRPTERPSVPDNLDWDLWLGPAPERPYHPTYLPANWRRWWDFGGGTLSDMACHHTDLPFWALDLHVPKTVQSVGPPPHAETAAVQLTVRYEYEARGDLPPVNLTWYDGGLRPPHFREHNLPEWGDGCLFVGDKGMLLADYDKYALLPEADFEGYEPPDPTIPRSIGHHREWIQACKTGDPTTCNFEYSGALTEAVLLGKVSYITAEKIEWNSRKLRAENSRVASSILRREYRKGWEV